MTAINFKGLTLALVSLLVIGLIANCKRSEDLADLIFINGKVITMDNTFAIASAIAIKGSHILAVGSNKEVTALAGVNTKIIDLAGKSVIPGLIDAHTHMDGAAISELYQSIPAVTNVDDVLKAVSEKTKVLEKGTWIVIPKLFSTRLIELHWPSKDELDQVAPDHPVFLDGSYAAMVNSYALNASGINKDTHDKGVLVDEQSGEPTGIIRRSSFKLLNRKADPIPSRSERLDAVVALMGRYNQVGITSVNIRYAKPADILFYQDIVNQGRSSVRTNLTFHQSTLGIENDDPMDVVRKKILALGFNTGYGNEWVRVGPLKWQIDGGILTGTAYLREPWAKYFPERVKDIFGITDPEYDGVPQITKEKLASFISLSEELGWDFTAHCTGGAGVDLMLDAYDQVRKLNPATDRHFSIIHGNFYTPESIKKMKRLRVYADMQPAWFYKDADAIQYLLGDNWLQSFHPYRSMFEAEIVVNGGSDHMVKLDSYTSVNPYNPFLAMWSVITRKTERGSTLVPNEAISRMQALTMYTINNAYLTSEQAIKGSLEAGKLADLAVISKDFLTCPVNEIKNIHAEITVTGGNIVFQKYGSADKL